MKITKEQFDELVIDVLASINDHIDDENDDRDLNDQRPHYTPADLRVKDFDEYFERNE